MNIHWDFPMVLSIVSAVVAISAVCASVYAAKMTRRSVLNGAYFAEMTAAYVNYLDCISAFVQQPGQQEKTVLVTSVVRLSLFAPDKTRQIADSLYANTLAWAQSGCQIRYPYDQELQSLTQLMRKDLATFQKTGASPIL